jgi:hypothetical protein
MGLQVATRFQIVSTPVVLNNDAYDANDVIYDTTALTHPAFNQYGGPFKLEQIEFWDSNDQAAAALTFVFLNSNVTYGTKDSAPSISDADSLFLTGQYVAASANILDHGGLKYGLWNPNIMVYPSQPSSTVTSATLYHACASAGTPTYLTGCLQLRFTFSAAS